MPRENGVYRMWYGSTVSWDAGNGEMLHVIKQAVSNNGHDWQRDGVAVPTVSVQLKRFPARRFLATKKRGITCGFPIGAVR